MDKQTATVTLFEKKVEVKIGEKLSALTEKTAHPCGGRGSCGKCKVIARGALSPVSNAEKKHLTAEELEKGIRLACCTHILGDCSIEELPNGEDAAILLAGGSTPTDFCNLSGYGVAVDIGTTTLAAKLFDEKGKELAAYGALNPEASFGADVISRIEAAMGGADEEIAFVIRNALVRILLALSQAGGISPSCISSVVITGNTAMLYLLTGSDTEPLSHAPFRAPRLFGEEFSPAELDITCLSPDAKIYLPRCISAFVGADTVCALLASKITESEEPAVLADIGTNGEIALWNAGKLSVCSSAAGPAFEGAQISMGMRGERGAIDRVECQNGVLCVHTIGETVPKGICGSGLVDAIAALLQNGTLDETGYLEDEEAIISPPVSLTQKDIRMVQLAKSAIRAGILTLMKSENLSLADVGTLYLAGGFGSYLNVENAGRIGLIPPALSQKVKVIGNAALAGAVMLLLNSKLRERADDLAHMANTFNLAESSVFSDEYMHGMMF